MNQPARSPQIVVTRFEAYTEHRRIPATPLRALRALNNLSASKLARLADVDRSTIRRLEAGIGHPQDRTARKIAAVLNCPVGLLFPRDEEARTAEPLIHDEEAAGQRPLVTTAAGQGRRATE
jgi:transcriptional regulator with XRE-family HTH domain